MRNEQNEREYLVHQICTQYTEQQHTDLDDLKTLDRRVKAPARRIACLLGTGAALIMGSGMSLVMTDIGRTIGLAEPFWSGLVLGLVGLLLAVGNYPLYCGLLGRRRKKYAPKILALGDQILRG